MEDKMAAGAFGRSRNYGWGGLKIQTKNVQMPDIWHSLEYEAIEC